MINYILAELSVISSIIIKIYTIFCVNKFEFTILQIKTLKNIDLISPEIK